MRTYKTTGKHINTGKSEAIFELAKQYKKYYNVLCKRTLYDYYKNTKIDKYPESLDVSLLSERYKQCCRNQVVSTLKSLISNVQIKFSETVNNSSLTKEEKIMLLYINKYKNWHKKEILMKGNSMPEYILKLARLIFKNVIGRIPRMSLDNKVAELTLNDNNQTSFDYWIKLSTLEKGKPIYLPTNSYEYLNSKQGKFKNIVQVIVKNNKIEFGLVKEFEVENSKNQEFEKILGLDLGICNLISTSTGNHYGKIIYKLLKKYNKILEKLLNNRTKQDIKNKKDKSVQRIYQKIHSLLKNEVGRCLNRMLDNEKPSKVIMENLTGISQKTKQNNKLNKSLRKILNNCGLTKCKDRLKQKCEERNIELEFVNPAYTSQTCSVCGFVHKTNRKSQSEFVCKACGHTENADINAAKNILFRSSIKEIGLYTSFNNVKNILDVFYQNNNLLYLNQNCGCNQATYSLASTLNCTN